MAYTQDQLDRLDAAIASGALSVRNANGELVTYRSMDDMLRARSLLSAQVHGARAHRPGVYPQFRRFPILAKASDD